MKEIYTIGYTAFPDVIDFIDVLEKYGINFVIDVRSEPFSEYYKKYNKNNISLYLEKNNILYANFRREFGARQTQKKYFTDGILDFEKFSLSEQFQSGFLRIKDILKQNYQIVLMCAEKYPETCHRNIMIAKFFYQNGYEIKNILADKTFVTQKKIEEILLNKYFPDRFQISLFDNLNKEEMIAESYKKANKEIGFKIHNI